MSKNSIIIPVYFHTDESRNYELINSDEIPNEYFAVKDMYFFNIDAVMVEPAIGKGREESRIYCSGTSFCSPLQVNEVLHLIKFSK